MGASRIIAISDKENTKYLVSAYEKWDEETEKSTFHLKTGDQITDAESFTKKQANAKINLLKRKGFFALAINPFEEGRVFRVSIKIIEPNWKDETGFKFKMDYQSVAVRFPDRISYTNRNKILKFDSLYEYLNSFNFKSREDAKHFIDNNSEQVFELFKNAFELRTYYH